MGFDEARMGVHSTLEEGGVWLGSSFAGLLSEVLSKSDDMLLDLLGLDS